MEGCRFYRNLISEYLEGQIRGEVRRRLEDHFSSCEGCRRELEGVRSVIRALNGLEPLKASPDLDLIIRGMVREELIRSDDAPGFLRSFRDHRVLPVLATAAAVLVLSLGALFLYRTFRGGSTGGRAAPPMGWEFTSVGSDVHQPGDSEVRKYILERIYPQDIHPLGSVGEPSQFERAYFRSAKYLVF